jgi:hypothetical protein
MNLKERHISPRMGLPMSPFSKEMRLIYEQGYHNNQEEGGLLPSSKTPVEETQEMLAQEEQEG